MEKTEHLTWQHLGNVCRHSVGMLPVTMTGLSYVSEAWKWPLQRGVRFVWDEIIVGGDGGADASSLGSLSS